MGTNGKYKNDALGTRMKQFYEKATRIFLPRRAYTIIRLDGKAFHTYTRGLVAPFDMGLVEDMDATAMFLCNEIQGAKCAFVQSDEITILVTDFDKIETSAWYDNNLQKMCSISASLATAKFNSLRAKRNIIKLDDRSGEIWSQVISAVCDKLAMFDSRVFQIPSKGEVMNNFIWRQQDTVKNSISTVAQSLYSHTELHNKNGSDKQEMIFQKGINWNDYDPKLKRGRMIIKETYKAQTIIKETNSIHGFGGPDLFGGTRTRWISIAPPTFTQNVDFLDGLIPTN